MLAATAEAPRKKLPTALILAIAAAILSSLFLTKNVDFRVYWIGAQSPFAEGHVAYGPESGAGYPMNYRYPPVTYGVFKPLTAIPLFWAGVLWNLGAWAAWIATVRKAIRDLDLRFQPWALAAACACAIPYVVAGLRSGNVQPYLIAAIFGAMLWSQTRPLLAAMLLAAAITFKLWPMFFVPWFLWPGRRRVLVWLTPALAAIWLAPLVVWSPGYYLFQLGEWYHAHAGPLTDASEIWFYPGQSIRGVMLRYLTADEPFIAGFPKINLANLAPSSVVRVWQGIAILSVLGTFVAMLRSRKESRWGWDAFSFALWTVVQPFCLKTSMTSLLPPILMAAAAWDRSRGARRAFLAATALAMFAGIAQYEPLLRMVLALGVDFYAALLILIALALAIRDRAV